MPSPDARIVRDPPAAIPSIVVWPGWQRMLHWLLAAFALVALATWQGGAVHEISGYIALAAVLARITLGIAGPRAARFAAFVRGPSVTLHYARALRDGHPPRYINHTPLGAWMVVTLLLLGLLAGASGALYVTDRFWGESWAIRMHALAAWPFVVLVPLHLAGVLHASVAHRENLVRAMIDGRKPTDTENPE